MPKNPFRAVFSLCNSRIKPDQGEGTYVLFRHFENILGSVTLFLKMRN